jgi:[citrate (pro-3S)-lyase] ligase
MNCNPFTYGHRYLIEQALERVDNLIIFVVQEDESLFTFRERYAMVREGIKDLENVTVVPSGDFILSQLTFPEYFIKIEDEDLEYNTEYDITLFAEEIAPKLNITVRFVGEEKADEVTNRYNLAMKKILPKHGIRIVEIPRKVISDGKQPISATKVREILEKNGELAHTRLAAKADGGCILAEDELTGLIPEGTRKLLLQTWE